MPLRIPRKLTTDEAQNHDPPPPPPGTHHNGSHVLVGLHLQGTCHLAEGDSLLTLGGLRMPAAALEAVAAVAGSSSIASTAMLGFGAGVGAGPGAASVPATPLRSSSMGSGAPPPLLTEAEV